MRGRLWTVCGTLVIVGLVASVPWAAENTWVMSGGRGATVVDLDPDSIAGIVEIELGDLADGETRVLGEGEQQVELTRDGDAVRIRRLHDPDAKELTIICAPDEDGCRLQLLPGASGEDSKMLVMVHKEAECETGDDCEDDLSLVQLGDHGLHGDHVTIQRFVRCERSGECTSSEAATAMEGQVEVLLEKLGAGHAGAEVFVVGPDGSRARQAMLRCPEGDTTMRIADEDKGDVFLCPRHSVPLEAVEHKVHQIRVKTDSAREF